MNPKVGFLPLYIKLYDDMDPETRAPLTAYMETLASMLAAEGLDIVRAPVCCVRNEFEAAARKFIDSGIDVIVTYHLAYSPSLESIGAIKSVGVPVVALNTTPRYDLSANMDRSDIMPNHGIHGVQDLCNLLKRCGCFYSVEAGHAFHSNVIARVAGFCRAAKAARAFKNAKVGSVGGAFDGMGDFVVPSEVYRRTIGARVLPLSPKRAAAFSAAVTEDDINAEIKADADRFCVEVKDAANYRAATRAGLALRQWELEEGLTGLTVNFMAMKEKARLPKMPFLELSKAMMRGVGYAGEGDTLTAGMVGALLSVYRDTTFTEMFCPDWALGCVLLSHMAEMNLNLSCYRPVLSDVHFPYASTGDTVAAYGCMRKGDAVLVNLAPTTEGYNLIVSSVEMLDLGREHGSYRYAIEGWMKPGLPLSEYLKAYSFAGGTHHSALVYGAPIREIEAFGRMMTFNTVVI